MRLRRLTINALPGITPGFPFEPPDAGVILVTGPNAIGKSSLARALRYLLGGIDRGRDPPALSLEAEFDSDGTRWQVHRNGGQIVWMRDGEVATAPQLPSRDQISLYRLSMESLLADDQDDQALAERTWRELRGGFDLDAPRIALGNRWGRKEESALSKARGHLGTVERHYAALQADEAKLPDLDRDIQAAKQAGERLKQLEVAMELRQAIDQREARQEAINQFPSDMDKLKGNELERLRQWDSEIEKWRKDLDRAQRRLEVAEQEREASGLAETAPQAEAMIRMEERLKNLDGQTKERQYAQQQVIEARAHLEDAQSQFEGGDEAPSLSTDNLERAVRIAEPLIEAQAQQRNLKQQLELAGESPDDSEIDQLKDGIRALRSWLATNRQSNQPSKTRWQAFAFVALGLALSASLAFIDPFWGALAGVLTVGLAAGWSLASRERQTAHFHSVAEDAKRAFGRTGLEPPDDWSDTRVQAHLDRTVEARLNALILQKERAARVPELRWDIERTASKIRELEIQKAELAKAIGFNPELVAPSFHRFIDVAGKWDRARVEYGERNAALSQLDDEIAAQAAEVRRFLDPWRATDAPPFEDACSDGAIKELRIAFGLLKERLEAARGAQSRIGTSQHEIRTANNQIEGIEKNIQSLFIDVALDSERRDELEERINRHEEWKLADEALRNATNNERRLRNALAEQNDLFAAVEGNEIERLRVNLERTRSMANSYTDLIKERQRIETQLDEAGRGHDLEQAAGDLDAATAALEDKRDEALRSQATETLLDEIEDQFRSEHEPDQLRRAKEHFEQVTAHEFSLELRDSNRFAARDLKQGHLRTLEELSSGTRMQLLLALRLAWTEAQEQGGESRPLFLDEALTTSDEDRFAVMANTLTRLAEAGDRQIFYLSARRHESALWRQATGAEPPVVDLAEVRFGTTHLEPEDFQVETPPSLPSPAGHDAASYAALLGVPRFDPHLEPGGIHLFHLLRDDLELLHRLMATWRIATLGQLDSLLSSNAAEGAIPDTTARSRLKQRCEAARAWTDLWRQGRGRPVNRAALEQSGTVSDTFIDRAAELANELQGDGTALINALRQHRLPGFRTTKANELERWLADEGYTDDRDRLSPGERTRLTLAIAGPSSETDAADVNQVVNWLEAAWGSSSAV